MTTEEKKYFHQLTKQEWMDLALYKESISGFSRPNWCNFEKALDNKTGCIDLLIMEIRSIHDCYGCNFCGVN